LASNENKFKVFFLFKSELKFW